MCNLKFLILFLSSSNNTGMNYCTSCKTGTSLPTVQLVCGVKLTQSFVARQYLYCKIPLLCLTLPTMSDLVTVTTIMNYDPLGTTRWQTPGRVYSTQEKELMRNFEIVEFWSSCLSGFGVFCLLVLWLLFLKYVWNIRIFQGIIYDQFISICWNIFCFLSALSFFLICANL